MEENSIRMSLMSHVTELRKRLLVSVVGLIVAVFISFIFSQPMAEFLAKPIGGLSAMSSIEVTENVSVFMKISLLSGAVLALPLIVYEILAFIFPGLTSSERRWIWFVIPISTILFLSGVAFTYFVMLPAALPFLLSFMGITTTPRPGNYFNFVLNLLFWVGVAFELPLIVLLLSRLGVVTSKQLAKQWRIAIVVIAVLSAVITPTPDPVNMGLMMLPLFILYILSIGFASVGQKLRKRSVEGDEPQKATKPQKKGKKTVQKVAPGSTAKDSVPQNNPKDPEANPADPQGEATGTTAGSSPEAPAAPGQSGDEKAGKA